VPLHKLRRTDPNWSFERIVDLEREQVARSTFFLMTGFGHRADPEPYGHLLPRLVEALDGAEIGLHGSYRAADQPTRLAEEKSALEQVAGPVSGQRFHYLRLNLPAVEAAGFCYDSSLGFSDAIGFRAGIAHPFRPWGTRLVEIPLAAMDVTLGERRYLGLSAREAERPVMQLLDWAAEHGGGFALLWHTDRFDRWTARGWDRLYERVLAGIAERGGVCLSAGELAEEADAWLP
jgi:peptidoglycan/xylan/chitin deacetylase (PgdA/CDA1 family)